MESTRDRLVEAATKLLDAGGPAAVTLREVGKQAGVSHNAPYKHFAGKQDLLAAVAARELRQRRTTLTRRRAGSPAEALRAALHGYVSWATRHPQRFKLVFGAWSIDSTELGDAATEAREALVGIVVAAQDAGDLPPSDPERLTALLMAAAHGAADLALNGHLSRSGKGRANPSDLVDDLLDHLRR